MRSSKSRAHPKGEFQLIKKNKDNWLEDNKLAVETFGGRVHVEWDPHSAVTPLGQLPFFIEFLKLGNLLIPWIEECPLPLISNNAPSKTDILGTLMLSILAGHRRYAYITSIRCDGINPGLLGMRKVISEDSMRRSLSKIPEAEGIAWLQKHFHKCYAPLLEVPWILDVDTTVKPLYGKQEGAVVGYNPRKPGRPSHIYHTFSIANLRLILDVEVHPGNEMASSYTAPDLWSLLERLPKEDWPQFLRGDCAFGTDGVMSVAEQKDIPYLFKLKLTSNVKRLISKLMNMRSWISAGKGWEGQESELKLMGWSKHRRVIVLRRRIQDTPKVAGANSSKQLTFNFGDITDKTIEYEYAVLVTTLPDEVLSVAQYYRDRADSENIFDELKNQWGWGGYTTQDLKRCRIVARCVALIYNWWNIYSRLADPDKHLEAITSRPLLLHAVGKQTSHAGQTSIKISSTHGKMDKVKRLISRIKSFFEALKNCAEQLTFDELWNRILSKALEKYLRGTSLRQLILLPNTG